MERLPFKRPADIVRAHIIEALKNLPREPEYLSDTEVEDWVGVYGDLEHDLSGPVERMAAEAEKRGIVYVADEER